MMRWLLCLSAVALFAVAVPAQAGEITGQYIEARTTEVFAGPCFANADTSLAGKNAVMAWKVDKGSLDGVTLDGLGIAAVVAASDTLGMPQSGAARALLIVDTRANAQQRDALVRLAKKQAGKLLDNVVAVQSAPVEFTTCSCKEGGCAVLTAGTAKIETRCINAIHDKTCGNEYPMYPPLASNVKARVAFTVEHSFQGKGMNETWRDADRRGAYLGTFEVR